MSNPGARWALVAALLIALPACRAREDPEAVAAAAHALRAALDAPAPPAFAAPDAEGKRVWADTRQFYEQTGYRLAWSDGRWTNSRVKALAAAVAAADREGLEPADFNAAEIGAYPDSRLDAARAVNVDLHCTYAYLRYARQLAHGAIDPKTVVPTWGAVDDKVDFPTVLQSALADSRVAESLQALTPAAAPYAGLRHQLARYRLIAAGGGFGTVPAAEIQGDDTSVPVEQRIEQIAMNMERWRWLPRDLGDRYLIVNIPAFRLDVVEGGSTVLAMDVVTGKKESPTPMLIDEMTNVVFSPYWNIPASIVRDETIPRLIKDPAYLEKNNMELVGGSSDSGDPIDPASIDWSSTELSGIRIRQRPGRGNSLGLVKFIFPNHFNVYLHDTPAQALFDRIERDFSHGCVRVERPLDLAKYVLRDQPEFTEDKITKLMGAGVERSVRLKQPLPVYLVYFTAWDENGHLATRPDVYGHDKRHRTAAEPQ